MVLGTFCLFLTPGIVSGRPGRRCTLYLSLAKLGGQELSLSLREWDGADVGAALPVRCLHPQLHFGLAVFLRVRASGLKMVLEQEMGLLLGASLTQECWRWPVLSLSSPCGKSKVRHIWRLSWEFCSFFGWQLLCPGTGTVPFPSVAGNAPSWPS